MVWEAKRMHDPHKAGNQTIKCDVSSCAYHDTHYCGLDSIDVSPIKGASSGKACDETLCNSYRQQ